MAGGGEWGELYGGAATGLLNRELAEIESEAAS